MSKGHERRDGRQLHRGADAARGLQRPESTGGAVEHRVVPAGPLTSHPGAPGSGLVLCGSLSRWAVPLGAAMHEAGYRVLGLPWRYMPFEVDETTLASAVASMRPLKIRGFGVSMPFKESVVSLVDRVEDRARRIGAVNTIVNDAGTLVGHNTDWVGAVRALEEVRALRGARALVLGAGGAARAVAFGLVESGASVTLCNRTLDRARALGEALGVGHIAWEERRDAARYDILVNASSLGMKDVDPTSPMPRDSLGPNLVVMDIVYKPVETELVRDARARRAGTIHGGRMLLHQAAAQFELYTGRRAPLDALDNALRAGLA